jgi:hypothetical protein
MALKKHNLEIAMRDIQIQIMRAILQGKKGIKEAKAKVLLSILNFLHRPYSITGKVN